MKRHILSFFSLMFAVTITAQTLNVVTGNVTYAFPAAKVGDMTCTDATTLTIGGKVFAINDINKIYVDNSEVTDNEVTVIYDGSTASLTVAGNVAPYVTPSVRGAHVSIAQSNTADVDGNEITYTLSGASSDAGGSGDPDDQRKSGNRCGCGRCFLPGANSGRFCRLIRRE